MRCLALGLFALLVAGCSSTQSSTFAVSGVAVDPVYSCPGGANNAPYDLHGVIYARNGTGKAVTIDSVTAAMKLIAVQGPWLEKPGDRYDAGVATFSPSSVAASSTSTVSVTIGSACTSGTYGSGSPSHGDYAVMIKLVTSAGTYSVTAENQHQIRAAI